MSAISDTILRLKDELPSDVELVAVSKFHPVDAIVEAYDAGQRLFGESRPQELHAKILSLQEMASGSPGSFSDIEWHFIGHLQTNKLKLVLPYVSLVESVDSLHLLQAIDRWGEANDRITDVLLEYHIASESSKQGFSREEILSLLCPDLQDTICSGSTVAASGQYEGRRYPHVRIRGLMGMATFTGDEAVVRADFARLMSLYDEIIALRDAGHCHEVGEDFNIRSFGMTHDYRIAVSMGADMVRIGTLIFGERA